jgi:hypothetical protein
MERVPLKASNFLLFLIAVSTALFYGGCGVEEPLERVRPESKPYTKRLPAAYNDVQLNKSTSTNVLEVIKQYKQELISQSESVVASYGEKKGGYQSWMTIVAFDEEEFTATRKYFLAVNEKPWIIGARGQKLRFDTEEVLDEQTLSEAYTSENQKRIAILKKVLENLRKDISQIRQESKIPDIDGMMINQTFERILYVLDQSPALAERLDQPNGLDFDHLTMGKGRVGLKLEGKIVKVKIRIGRMLWNWKEKRIEKAGI